MAGNPTGRGARDVSHHGYTGKLIIEGPVLLLPIVKCLVELHSCDCCLGPHKKECDDWNRVCLLPFVGGGNR